jgi:hypothetical protein
MGLYIHSPICRHCVVLNYLSTGAALPFFYLYLEDNLYIRSEKVWYLFYSDLGWIFWFTSSVSVKKWNESCIGSLYSLNSSKLLHLIDIIKIANSTCNSRVVWYCEKGNIFPVLNWAQCHVAIERVEVYKFLTTALDGSKWQALCPRHFTLGKEPWMPLDKIQSECCDEETNFFPFWKSVTFRW